MNVAFTIIFAIYFSVFCGLRFFCDVDYEPYFSMYELVPPLNEFSIERIKGIHGEFGYLLFSSAFRFLGIDFPWFALVVSTLSIFGKSYFAQKVSGAGFYVLNLYFFVCFIIVEFIQVRWGLAITFLALGYYFYFRSKIFISLAFFALAVANHYYSILFIFLLPFANILRVWQCWIIFFSCFFIALLYKLVGFSLSFSSNSGLYIVQKALRYLNNPDSNIGFFSFAKCFYYPASVFFLIKKNPIIKKDAMASFIIKLGFLLMSAALFLSFVPIFFFRAIFVADFVFLAVIVRLVNLYFPFHFRFAFMLFFSIPLILWFSIDLSGVLSAKRIWEYKSWLDVWL